MCLAVCVAMVIPAPAAPAAPAPEPTLTWVSCGVGQECAWLPVPIDYDNPAAGTIELRLIRLPARTADLRGSIVVNPGGPGASGVAFVRQTANTLPSALRNHFHIVGFDTRGSGDSSPLRCVDAAFLNRYVRTESTPTTDREITQWMRMNAAWSPGCRSDQRALSAHMDTASIVRDVDRLREALGADAMNFLGFSYGTVIAGRYAQTFPDRVGRFVLDGGVDTRLDAMDISQQQAAGFQRTFVRFTRTCARTVRCSLGRSALDIITRVNQLLDDIERTPLPTRSGRTLVESEAITAIVTALYARSRWPALWSALAQAYAGDGTELQRIADLGNGRADNFAANFQSPFLATTCLDLPRPPGRTGLQRAARQWANGAPVPKLSAFLAWSNAPCTRWFATGSTPQPITSTTSAPILVIGTRYDPATPFTWSVAMHRQLPTSSLLRYEGDGHTAFGSGSDCVDDSVTQYFLTGRISTLRCASP